MAGVEQNDAVGFFSCRQRENNKDILYIDIEASGFLYNMARNIVGTLIEVGRGKMEPEYVKIALLKKDRSRSGPTAPAKGLCLLRVRY